MHGGVFKKALVGGDNGQVHFVGQIQEPGLGLFFYRQAVAHQFYVKTVGKNFLKALHHRPGFNDLSICQQMADRTQGAAG